MIARIWSCRAARTGTEAAIQHIVRTGVAECRTVDGYLGGQILRSDDEDPSASSRITLVTYWQTRDSIRRFAGADITRAVLYPDDEAYGLRADDAVTHCEVVYHDNLAFRISGGTDVDRG